MVVQILLEAGADVNAPASSEGRMVLQAAATTSDIELVRTLLEIGADVNAPAGEEKGRTALQAAATWATLNSFEFCWRLVQTSMPQLVKKRE